jgi:hypothetical protein
MLQKPTHTKPIKHLNEFKGNYDFLVFDLLTTWARKILRKIFSLVKENSVEDPHQSDVDEIVQKTRYDYLRNQERKIQMVRTCGKNARRNNCKESV